MAGLIAPDGRPKLTDFGLARLLDESAAHLVLPRRLALDFGDLTGEGLSFDTMTGTFQLTDGEAYTDNLTLRGSAAEIGIAGVVAAHPVAGPVDREHGAVVEEPVEDRGGDGGVVEDLAPLCDAPVGGEDDRAVLVASRDDLEEMTRGLSGERQVAKLIDDQERRAVPEAHRRLPAAFEGRALALGDEVGGGGVVDAVAVLGGVAAQGDGEHCLADAGRPDQQDVALLLDETQRCELVDHAAVERGLGVVVDLGERLWRGEAGEAQPALESASLGRLDLDREEPLEEARVGGLALVGVLQGRGELLGGRLQAQVGEMRAQLLVDALLAHEAATSFA